MSYANTIECKKCHKITQVDQPDMGPMINICKSCEEVQDTVDRDEFFAKLIDKEGMLDADALLDVLWEIKKELRDHYHTRHIQ